MDFYNWYRVGLSYNVLRERIFGGVGRRMGSRQYGYFFTSNYSIQHVSATGHTRLCKGFWSNLSPCFWHAYKFVHCGPYIKSSSRKFGIRRPFQYIYWGHLYNYLSSGCNPNTPNIWSWLQARSGVTGRRSYTWDNDDYNYLYCFDWCRNESFCRMVSFCCFCYKVFYHWYVLSVVNVGFHYLSFLAIVFGFTSGKIHSWFLHLVSNDSILVVSVTVAVTMVSFLFLTNEFGTSGIICLLLNVILINNERRRLAPETKEFLLLFWSVMADLVNYYTLLRAGVVVGSYSYESTSIDDLPLIFITYTCTMFGRLLMYLLLSPLLSRISPGINFRQMLVCVWCGNKGILNIIMLFTTLELSKMRRQRAALLCHVSGMILCHMLINETTTKIMLSFLGLDVISLAREVNMNNCMKHILSIRDRTITILKLDRYASDSNWPLVSMATLIQHPYASNLSKDSTDDGSVSRNRTTVCPNPKCRKIVVCQPTPKEYEEMTLEARKRVFKAKKVSYSRQHENGMLTGDSVRILNNSVDIAMENPHLHVKIEELLKMFQIKKYLEYIKKTFVKVSYDEAHELMRLPRVRYRRICYYMVRSNTFNYIINVVVVISCIHAIVYMGVQNMNFILGFIDSGLCVFYFFVLGFEFLVKILANSFVYIWADGVRAYFKSKSDRFDFYIFITVFYCAVIGFVHIVWQPPLFNNKQFVNINVVIESIRILRVYRMFRCIGPVVVNMVNGNINAKMTQAYDVGKGFVTAEQEILEMLPQMIDEATICEKIRGHMEADKQAVLKELGTVQREYPLIALNVKTRQIIRTTLNGMLDSVQELKTLGWVDDTESRHLITSIKSSIKAADRLKKISTNPPKVFFEEVTWLRKESIIINFLLKYAIIRKYAPGDELITHDAHPEGIFIICSGLFKLSYAPVENVMDAFYKYGALPVIDYLTNLNFEQKFIDYLVAGNTCGELSFLTGRPYACSIVADSFSQVYFLSAGVLCEAMAMDSNPVRGLRARMWKSISTRLSCSVLVDVPAYYGASQTQIRMALQKSFCPDLPSNHTFINQKLIEDLILIDGMAMDVETKKTYCAPCYIPRHIEALKITTAIPDNKYEIGTKLLIIPWSDTTPFDIMTREEELLNMMPKREISKMIKSQYDDLMSVNDSNDSKSKKVPYYFGKIPGNVTDEIEASKKHPN